MTETWAHSLRELGWSDDRAAAFEPHADAGLVPGRVVSSGGVMQAATAEGLSEVILQRRFRRSVSDRTGLPTIGDWLALEPQPSTLPRAALRAVLPRKGAFIRERLSDGRPQVLGANLDIAFLVSGLDQDLNLRRIERYLLLTLDGGVTPIVVLNKADVAVDLPAVLARVEQVAPSTRVIVTSALTGDGLAAILDSIEPGKTACLLGSSGVGKSTLTNALLGEQRQLVQALREDDSRGRHTTSHRELFVLASGGLLIDTPGLRTVGVPGDSVSLATSFSDVEDAALRCRFPDCSHQTEPGCAVRAAIDDGSLSEERLESHEKLEAEQRQAALRADLRAQREADRRQTRSYRKIARDASRYKGGG